jgi:hypothetical protein
MQPKPSAATAERMVIRILALPFFRVVIATPVRFYQCNTDGLQDQIQAVDASYLGHKNIPRTVHYTELSPPRFKDF